MNMNQAELHKIAQCLTAQRGDRSEVPDLKIRSVPYLREHWSGEFGQVGTEQISAFAASIEDLNPLHHDDEAAKKKRIMGTSLFGRIQTGVRLIGYASPTVVANFPDGMIVEIENMRFPRPLYAGSLPTVHCAIVKTSRKLTRVAIELKNGFETIVHGTCVIAHDG